ncbi:MAG: hypothetical protein DMG12_26865 [Acidobacteria bacterium]|nr:MAG: hypothetical protein DMG12_26865 [Acidobacteriota bacterium]
MNSTPSAPTNRRSTHAVNNPAAIPNANQGDSGRTSSIQDSLPRRHHITTSSAAGSVAVTLLLSRAAMKSASAKK